MPFHVYAIAHRDDAARAATAHALLSIAEGPLAAVGVWIDSAAPSPAIDAIRRFEQTTRAIFEHTSIIPTRYPSVFQNESEARRFLACRRDHLLHVLERLSSACELAIHLSRSQPATSSPSRLAPAPPLVESSTRTGAAYLEAKRLEQNAALPVGPDMIELSQRELRPMLALARAWKLEGPRPTMPFDSLLMLVDRSKADDLASCFTSLRPYFPSPAILTGPAPPYSFADVEETNARSGTRSPWHRDEGSGPREARAAA